MTTDVCDLAAAAMKAVKDNNVPEAIAALDRLVAEDASSVLWPTLRARLMLDKGAGEPRQALADAERALSLQPGNAEALLLQARALKAIDPASSGVVSACAQLASMSLTAKQREELEQLRQERATVQPVQYYVPTRSDNCQVICEQAAAACSAWKEGNKSHAQELLLKLQNDDCSSSLWPLLLARVHLAEQTPSEAIAVCSKALTTGAYRRADLLLARGMARLQAASSSSAEDAKADISQARDLGGFAASTAQDLSGCMSKLGIECRKGGEPGKAKTSASSATPAKASAPAAASKSSPSSSSSKPASASAATKPSSTSSSSTAPSTGANAGAIAAVLKARQAEDKGLFREARMHCAEALKLSPDLPQAVLCLARMELANGETSAVTKLIRKSHPSVLRRGPGRLEALSLVAAAAEEAGDWDTAQEELEELAPLAQSKTEEPPTKAGWAPQPKLSDILGRLAKARWSNGDRSNGTNLAQQILNAEQIQIQACEVACTVLIERGDMATALALMVKALIAHRNEPAEKCANLVCSVMRQCSVEELTHVLAPKQEDLAGDQANSIAEVVGYVGLIMKERGEIMEASRCYRKSVLLAPDNGSLCLNLMHTFALRRDDLRAIAWGERYFDRLAGKIPGARLISRTLRGDADVSTDAAPWKMQDFSGKPAFHDAIAMGFVLLKLLFLAHAHAKLLDQHGSESGSQEISWQAKLKAMDVEKETVSSSVSSLMEPGWHKAGEIASGNVPSGHACDAHQRVLLRLTVLLEKCRQGHDLHLTTVRNENAYFGCIREILQSTTPAAPPRGVQSLSPIYVVGDSHVLPCAWQTVDLRKAEDESSTCHVLIPNIVTGAKVWHLREKSKFYTKAAFWDKISSLPPGAPVILILGEIDCREGILRAVQKGKHNGVEAALQAVVDTYLALLQQVRKKLPSSEIFLHPVPNVLPETRSLTVSFNILLDAPATQAKLAKAKIKLLNFSGMFVGHPNGPPMMDASEYAKLELLPELKLDGTHLNPAYIASHLTPALKSAWAS
eukprot:TRINITY_DN4826_c0_g3_i1.p1 TRINITY_DN4826_c0_g3~~TRINITY_DN4826_c0_g3_i1.p1  ORF type:complete len:1022 (+),score=206.77 TRINITY_DN4826_c0_g3_i1:68-3133(+)